MPLPALPTTTAMPVAVTAQPSHHRRLFTGQPTAGRRRYRSLVGHAGVIAAAAKRGGEHLSFAASSSGVVYRGSDRALLVLDTAMLTTLSIVTPPLAWPLLAAIAASLIRIAWTARSLPAGLTR